MGPSIRARSLATGTCLDCGKRAYLSRRDAKQAARALHPDVALRPYQCGRWWHVGRTRDWVRRGDKPIPSDQPDDPAGPGPSSPTGRGPASKADASAGSNPATDPENTVNRKGAT